jgi:predicted kinase/aminoglycoside phosphotransferase family enzyme
LSARAPVPGEQAEAARLLAALSGDDTPVRTPSAVIWRGPRYAWKLLKADGDALGSLEARWRANWAEAREARRSLDVLPRDVLPLVVGPDGAAGLGVGALQFLPPFEYVQRIEAVPQARQLAAIAQSGRLSDRLADIAVDTLLAWHKASPAGHGGDAAGALRQALPRLLHDLSSFNGVQDALVQWMPAVLHAIDSNEALLAGRAASGCVRRHAFESRLDKLCIADHRIMAMAPPQAGEDSVSDIGFIISAMLADIEVLGDNLSACRAFARYIAQTGDLDLLAVLPLLMSLAAMQRAASLRLRDNALAVSYLRLGFRLFATAPPRIIAVGGLPGVGKSTLARNLAPGLGRFPGALVLRLDDVRKHEFRVDLEQPLAPHAYDEAANQHVFARLLERLHRVAATGHSVIADANFVDVAQREAVAACARSLGVGFLGLWLDAPLPMMEQRLQSRAVDASDANVMTLRRANWLSQGAGEWRFIEAIDQKAALRAAQEALRFAMEPC